jgi:hypothetical protein
LPATFNNSRVQAMRNAVQYHAVGAVAATLGEQLAGRPPHAEASVAGRPPSLTLPLSPSDVEALHAACCAVGDQLASARGVCLIMGDLWPRSVLVGPPEAGAPPPATAPPPRQWVIDWELCHWGNPAQDTAHLAAHAWMLHHAAVHGAYGMRAVACCRSGDATGCCRRSSSGSMRQECGATAAASPNVLARGMDAAWAGCTPAGLLSRLSPAAAYWRGFADAYDALAEALGGPGGSFAAAWAASGAPRVGRVHLGAEVLARMGAFRAGYVYDAGVASPAGSGAQSEAAAAAADVMASEALTFACQCILRERG